MSRSIRFGIAAAWLVVAFLILRMLWGGSLFGFIYVFRHDHPIVLLADGVAIVGGLAVALLLARGSNRRALRLSIALSYFTIVFSFVLATQDHGSAPAVGIAAVIALALARRTVFAVRSDAPPTPG